MKNIHVDLVDNHKNYSTFCWPTLYFAISERFINTNPSTYSRQLNATHLKSNVQTFSNLTTNPVTWSTNDRLFCQKENLCPGYQRYWDTSDCSIFIEMPVDFRILMHLLWVLWFHFASNYHRTLYRCIVKSRGSSIYSKIASEVVSGIDKQSEDWYLNALNT